MRNNRRAKMFKKILSFLFQVKYFPHFYYPDSVVNVYHITFCNLSAYFFCFIFNIFD